MKENKSTEKIKRFAKKKWDNFTESGSDIGIYADKQYHMLPVNLNWNQVFKGWAITLGIFILLWLFIW